MSYTGQFLYGKVEAVWKKDMDRTSVMYQAFQDHTES